MGDLIGGEGGGDDGVDGEEGEEAVGAFVAVWGAHAVFVAEEGVAVVGVALGLEGRGSRDAMVGWEGGGR